ncbi:hypothetical protein BDV93DRAFT_517536 [Ceratobasidium sp. AG-I]|nr:hypothetical protein BDV93DRAFT_517536 [Ceratobasidium sp. AG-I]
MVSEEKVDNLVALGVPRKTAIFALQVSTHFIIPPSSSSLANVWSCAGKEQRPARSC